MNRSKNEICHLSPATMTNVKIEQTTDGSLTVLDVNSGSTYHSRHGALTESMHVFITTGLRPILTERSGRIRILEMGFGTGLNALLTAQTIKNTSTLAEYHALEAYPLSDAVWREIVAHQTIDKDLFNAIHEAVWNRPVDISPHFNLAKHHMRLQEFENVEAFDLIYYDAFEPNAQPELWTVEVFQKLFELTAASGVLVTYCAKGDVRRAMQTAGYRVERLPGPPFKREMLRATRP